MSSRTPSSNTNLQDQRESGTPQVEPDITTKYETNTDTSTQPDVFTENAEELRKEFLGSNANVVDIESSETCDEDVEDTTPKYAHLISREQINAIPEECDTSSDVQSSRDVVIKGNYHSEVRFLERADLTQPDSPKSLQKAWETGVRVGVDHINYTDFYGYDVARYNEVANVIMVANENGMIETTLNVFENTMKIQTDHLCTCKNPDCGRLYSKVENGAGCHWCGFTESKGRLKTKHELLPKKGVVKTKQLENTNQEGAEEVTSVHTHDTTCEDCGEEFNTLTRLRLHTCE